MQLNGWDKCRYLIDGFPRNFENFSIWTEKTKDDVNIKGVILFNCPEVN